MKFDWNVMIILFGIVQSIFIFYLLIIKTSIKRHLHFVLWFSVLLGLLVESFMVRSGIIKYAIHLFKTPTPFIFLLGPLLYQYSSSQLGKSLNRVQWLFHFLPFVFYFLYSFYFFLQPYPYKYNLIVRDFHTDWELLPATNSFAVDPWNINGWVIVELIVLHLVLYCILGFVKVLSHRARISIAKKNWLVYLNSVMLISAIILFFSQGGIINGKTFLKSPFPHYSPSLFVTFVIYLTSFYLIAKTDLLKRADKKYKKSSLTKNYKRQKLKIIRAIIEEDNLYLRDTFSLKVLAEKSGLSTHHISQILNEELGYTFFELTNAYRVTEAKKRLNNSAGYIKIEHLAYDLGYKSKSTFYSAFKKATQLTPLQYRNSIS